MKLHPQVIEKNGRKEFVILPYAEFEKIQEALEDYEDLRDLRNAKAAAEGEATTSLNEARRMVPEDSAHYPQNPVSPSD